ncbi:hypothetical protein GQ53DRAFT_817933 [Thozetella sp. PMI_491]|nr:hypothetical protein GQ53DRAFT_817933 [Thozetella sp. PMI_491]
MRTSFFATLALVLALSLASGGFFGYCPEDNLYYQTLTSKCDGMWTSFDLDRVIANSNGNLVWRINGGFYGSCGSSIGGTCNLQSSVLGCDCSDGNGHWHWTTINLNDHIAYGSGGIYYN